MTIVRDPEAHCPHVEVTVPPKFPEDMVKTLCVLHQVFRARSLQETQGLVCFPSSICDAYATSFAYMYMGFPFARVHFIISALQGSFYVCQNYHQ